MSFSKSNESDYKNTLEVFADLEIQSFSELSECQKKELIGAWVQDDDNEEEVINMLIDFKRSGALAESMYESIDSTTLGKQLINLLMNGDHVKSINIDIDEAFGEHMMSLDGYESDDDAHRLIDNIDRVKCARMGF